MRPDLVGQRFHHLPHQRVVAFHEGAVHREITDAGAENGEDGDQHRFADGTLCLEMPAALRLWERRREGEALYPDRNPALFPPGEGRSEEHTSELQSLMRISYAVFCLKKKKRNKTKT